MDYDAEDLADPAVMLEFRRDRNRVVAGAMWVLAASVEHGEPEAVLAVAVGKVPGLEYAQGH